MRIFVSLLCSLLLIGPVNAQKAKLSLKLNEGETYKQISHSKININQDVYGMKMDIGIVMDGSASYLVTEVQKDAYDMELTYDWMKMSMDLPQTSMEFSSEKKDESDLFSSILAEMKNMPIKLKMDKKGRVLEIEDVDAMWEAVIDKFDQFPKDQREQVKMQLLQSYGGDAVKESIEGFSAIFPEKSVKKGEKWEIINQTKAGMPFNASTSYTYEGKEGDLVLISGQGSVESSNPDEAVEANGMMMKYNLSGTTSSNIKMDHKSGWIREAVMEKTIKGEATLQANDQIPEDMTIPMSISSETKVSSE